MLPFSILNSILYLLGAGVAMMVFSDIRMYLKLNKLKSKKGVKVFFFPRFYQLMKISLDMRKDFYRMYKHVFTQVKDKDWIVIPSPEKSGTRTFYPRSERAIKEYFKLEVKNFERFNLTGRKDLLGSVFASNEEGLTRRGFFSKLFHIENMKKMLPGLRDIIREHIAQLKAKVQIRAAGPNTEEGVIVDIKEEFMVDLVDDISSYLVLGPTTRNSVMVEGQTYVKKTKELFSCFVEIMISPVNMLTFGLARKYGFDPAVNKMKRINSALYEATAQEYKTLFNEISQEKDSDQSKLNTVINLLVKHNKEAEVLEKQSQEDGESMKEITGKEQYLNKPLSLDRIVDMILVFLFGGSDTSFNATTTTICLLSKNREIRERVVEEIFKDPKIQSSDYTFEDLDSKRILGACMKESLRLFSPAPIGFWRVATKPTKICDVTLEKGDLVQVSYISQSLDADVYKRRMQYNIERFLQEGKSEDYPKIKKTQYLPFSLGLRSCQGKNLAEMILKTVLTELLREFKMNGFLGDSTHFKEDPGHGFADNRIRLQIR